MVETQNMKDTIVNKLESIGEPEGKQYDLAKSTIATWPDWKREIFNRLMKLAT